MEFTQCSYPLRLLHVWDANSFFEKSINVLKCDICSFFGDVSPRGSESLTKFGKGMFSRSMYSVAISTIHILPLVHRYRPLVSVDQFLAYLMILEHLTLQMWRVTPAVAQDLGYLVFFLNKDLVYGDPWMSTIKWISYNCRISVQPDLYYSLVLRKYFHVRSPIQPSLSASVTS